MNDWRERLSARIAIPKSFDLQTHETDTGFQIVEPKDIPRQVPIVWSPLHMFFHEALVNHLQRYGAGIEKVKQAHIFRKSSGYVSDEYFTLTIRDQWDFSTLMTDDFHPALINMVQDLSGSMFFSRDYYNKVVSELSLIFQELPVIYLIPLGASE